MTPKDFAWYFKPVEIYPLFRTLKSLPCFSIEPELTTRSSVMVLLLSALPQYSSTCCLLSLCAPLQQSVRQGLKSTTNELSWTWPCHIARKSTLALMSSLYTNGPVRKNLNFSLVRVQISFCYRFSL